MQELNPRSKGISEFNDPRCFATDYPQTNIVINQALEVLEKNIQSSELKNTLSNLLKNENDALINVALNLSPNLKVSQIIWQELNNAINFSGGKENIACIFAIPIVIVAGSKSRVKLPNKVNIDELNKFFAENNIINANYDWFISGKLIDPQNIAKIKPSQLYYWVRNIQNAKLWLPIDIDGAHINIENEGVFLRFIVGVACEVNGRYNFTDIINFDQFKNSSMKFMHYLLDQLKTDGVTIFPIPFAPNSLSSSFAIGENYRKEIAISVALSNIVKKIRESGLTPIVNIASIESGVEIKTVTKESSDLQEISLWNLTPYDDLTDILHKLISLLQEMNLEYSINS